jgi:hypothetical protein
LKYAIIKDGVINSIKDMEKHEKTTVSELQAQIDHLNSLRCAIEMGIKNENTLLLMEECLNLIHGINIVEDDDYAPTRVYSKIPGVKNIRWNDRNSFLVKTTSPAGYLLPKEITIDERYGIVFTRSRNFSEKLDY